MLGRRFGRSGREAYHDQILACDACHCGGAAGGWVRPAAGDDPGAGAERRRDESARARRVGLAPGGGLVGRAGCYDRTAGAAGVRRGPGAASHPLRLRHEGHCDERGTNEYNVALGERRAKSAMDYLVSQGVRANRITIVSYGEERPLCTEHSEACWSKNRRAHFLVKSQ
ncbi:MAG: hypothetical protein DME12_14595 [Candidatus Rokuibacteriota bacterium]|nr:MAG: hypothetical protein DME12_14595 [Candidatus Rokubacteria bacterium]